jgi:coenzyme F420 biosynthesis associated uncharacterized protein
MPLNSRLARGAVAAIVTGAAVAMLAEAVRPRGGQAVLVDWDEVVRLARRRLPQDDALSAVSKQRSQDLYNRLAAELRQPLLDTVGGLPHGRLPDFEALDRQGWLDLNVGILRRAIDPVLASAPLPLTLVSEAGRYGLNRYVALILGFLSSRVLGQYDAQLLGKEPLPDAPGLYLVEPNIQAWEREAELPGDDLRRWLILHEMTHAWQFAAHPWLRDHMNSSLERVLASAGDRSQHPLSRLAGLTVGLPSQWAIVRSLQSTMSLVEGYGNLVMNVAGQRLLPGFDRLERAYHQRSRERGALEMLFWRLTGLELKLQQYRQGEAFCRAVYEAHGMAALNRAWESPETLPRPDELRDPEAWYRRVSLRQPATA